MALVDYVWQGFLGGGYAPVIERLEVRAKTSERWSGEKERAADDTEDERNEDISK